MQTQSENMIQNGLCLYNNIVFQEKIGQGAFGEVWRVVTLDTKATLACKVERKDKKGKDQLLNREIKFLLQLINVKGIPRIRLYGQDANHQYLIYQLLDKNLEEVKKQRKSISVLYALQIGIQLLDILSSINVHDEGIIHRDIKPENIMTTFENKQSVYLIDFGLAKRIIQDGIHIPFQKLRGMVGTARFASFRAMKGFQQSRRDDLESLFYTLIVLLKGTLPWFYVTSSDKEQRYLEIQLLKEQLIPERVWPDLPKSFIELFQHSRKLEFEQKPDYLQLRTSFQKDIEQFRQPEPSESFGLSPVGKSVNNKDFSKKLMLFNKSEKAEAMQSSQFISKTNNMDTSSIVSKELEEFEQENSHTAYRINQLFEFKTQGIKLQNICNNTD